MQQLKFYCLYCAFRVQAVEVTAANVNKREIVSALIRKNDEAVYGKAGYADIEKN